MAISEIQRLETAQELYDFCQAFADMLVQTHVRVESASTVYNKFDLAEMARLLVPGVTANDTPERQGIKALKDFFNEFLLAWEGTAVTPIVAWKEVAKAMHHVRPV